MKRKVFVVLWGLASLGALAQNAQPTPTDTLKMSLQDCIDYAVKNNVNIKNATLDEAIASAKVREIRGIGLPQINGSAGLQHYFKLRNSYFPGGGPFGPPADPNDPDPTKVIVYPAIFQLPTNLDANVTASQILFNASYIVGLQAAKTYKELSVRASQQTKEQTISNVKKAYFQNLVNTERIKLYDININRLDSTISQTRALQKNGFVEQIDLDRLEVTFNNLLTEYEKTLNLLILSSLQLKFQIGLPIENNMILTDKLEKYVADTSFKSINQVNPDDRVEYQLLRLQVKSNKLQLKNNRGEALPSLVLSGTIGAFSSAKDLNLFEGKKTAVFNSLTEAPSLQNTGAYFSSYSFFQVGLNVPLFTGLQRTNKVQQSKLSLEKSENNLKNFAEVVNLQVKVAKVNLQNSKQSLVIQQRNLDLAKKVSSNVFKKYKAGVSSNLEVITAEASLKESQINYFNALYDFLVNKIDFETAAGLNK
ncbi:MAG: TolC family protein [Cytophagales bacterium]